ncbi:LamG-like jellyroll fold domain-containing protein [Streptomyces sp. NPDC089799]|uniref:LamG-like jellyroll fold domain-containing protein n=1 Tax=Streptomyces sp. NPDC089799 TaxID=3155066 RepID=UPI00343F8194
MPVFDRQGLRHAMSAAMGAALILGVTPAQTPSAAAAAEGPAPALTEGQKALKEAAENGLPVEVIGDRSEFTTTYANPDGQTFRLDQSVVPVRVKEENGSWTTPDATLEVRGDGTVGPKAATADISFSGGGDKADLVAIGQGVHRLSLQWPGVLPKPALDGDTAVYAEVLPGVDLRMTATTEGYREVLVVKTPTAAKNPALKNIKFGLKAEELQVSASKDGGLVAEDSNGRSVFTSPPALMWDSSGGDDVPASQPSAQPKMAVLRAADTPRSVVQANAVAEDPDAEAPGPGDKSANLQVAVGADSLTVVPDAALLGQSDPAAFPLYIDPPVALDDGVERTLLRSDGYEFWNFDNDKDNQGKGVGKCGTWGTYYCGPGYIQRLYFEFSPKKLAGKEVLSARFRITEPWAFQCEVRNVWLVRTNGEISQSTTWANKPGYLDRMGDRWVSAGRGSLCDPNAPPAPIEFADNPDEPDENLTPTVRDFAAGKFKRLTLEIRAEDEGDTSSWKRFRNDAVLSVDYIARPAVPTAYGLVAGNGQVCATNESAPAVVSDRTPSLTATTEVVSGGEEGASLRAAFQIDRKNSDGSWTPVKQTPESWSATDNPSAGYVGANSRVVGVHPVTLDEGVLYKFRTWTRAFAGSLTPRGSVATSGCFFKVDASAPKAPKVTFGSPYSACTSTSCTAAGKPGTPGQVTFTPATGDSNNTKYEYKLSTEDDWTVKSGSSATVSVTPMAPGTHQLSVRAFDSLGRAGAYSVVDFVVKEGSGPVAYWNFNESSGPALDTSTTSASLQNNADLQPGSQRPTSGRRGKLATGTDRTLLLNGVDQYALTDKPVIDTRASFTVGGWARLDRQDKWYTMVSQGGGSHQSGVAITAVANGPWIVRMAEADGPDGWQHMTKLESKNPAVVGVWTHVAASYNASTNKMKLYVNGQLQGETIVAAPIAATKPMGIGTIWHRGAWIDQFPGRIDELKVWQDELTGTAVKTEAKLLDGSNRAHLALAATWDLEVAGNPVQDDTVYNRDLTLATGTTIKHGTLVLNGTSHAGTAAGPLVDDTGSFTATASADIDGAKLVGKPNGQRAQVIGQRTAAGSSWGIWFEKTGEVPGVPVPEDPTKFTTEVVGQWHFGRLTADGKGVSVTSTDPATLGVHVQLTGVYDAQKGTITLYVGGDAGGTVDSFTAAVGSGDFAVGRGFTGTWSHYLPGEIKDIHLWSGAAQSATQVRELTD